MAHNFIDPGQVAMQNNHIDIATFQCPDARANDDDPEKDTHMSFRLDQIIRQDITEKEVPERPNFVDHNFNIPTSHQPMYNPPHNAKQEKGIGRQQRSALKYLLSFKQSMDCYHHYDEQNKKANRSIG